MPLGKLNHVAIAVPDLRAAAELYRGAFGVAISAPQALADHGVTVVFVALPNSKIELLEPLGDNSPIAAFLAKNPAGGIHHLCFEVADIIASRDQILAAGGRGFSAMASQESAPMACPCCFSTRRIFSEP